MPLSTHGLDIARRKSGLHSVLSIFSLESLIEVVVFAICPNRRPPLWRSTRRYQEDSGRGPAWRRRRQHGTPAIRRDPHRSRPDRDVWSQRGCLRRIRRVAVQERNASHCGLAKESFVCQAADSIEGHYRYDGRRGYLPARSGFICYTGGEQPCGRCPALKPDCGGYRIYPSSPNGCKRDCTPSDVDGT